jgi:hypothetical protein
MGEEKDPRILCAQQKDTGSALLLAMINLIDGAGYGSCWFE